MRINRRWLGLLKALCMGALLVFGAPSWAALQEIPALSSPVTDLTHTLSAEQQQTLAAQLLAFEQEKGSQVAVLIVPTTQPEDIAQFAIRVAEAWKIGRAKQDDGVLLLVAKDDRKIRIEVGRGLEGAIPDIYAKRIISEYISPLFKQGDFYGGLSAGTEKITALIAGEQLPPPLKANPSPAKIGFDSAIGLFLMACLFIGSFFTGILGRFFGSTATGGVIGGMSVLAFGLATGAAVGALAFVFTLFIPTLFGGGATSIGRHYGGGYYGGGFGGGSSGWGGGGGTFGGGGASGDW